MSQPNSALSSDITIIPAFRAGDGDRGLQEAEGPAAV